MLVRFSGRLKIKFFLGSLKRFTTAASGPVFICQGGLTSHEPVRVREVKPPWTMNKYGSLTENPANVSQLPGKYQSFSPDHVPHEQEEGVSGRGAEVFAINRHLEAKHTHYIEDKRNQSRTDAVDVRFRLSQLKHTHHDVGVSVDELDEFLQTPEAALQTTQQELGKLILCSCERNHDEHLNISPH